MQIPQAFRTDFIKSEFYHDRVVHNFPVCVGSLRIFRDVCAFNHLVLCPNIAERAVINRFITEKYSLSVHTTPSKSIHTWLKSWTRSGCRAYHTSTLVPCMASAWANIKVCPTWAISNCPLSQMTGLVCRTIIWIRFGVSIYVTGDSKVTWILCLTEWVFSDAWNITAQIC